MWGWLVGGCPIKSVFANAGRHFARLGPMPNLDPKIGVITLLWSSA